MAERPTGSGRYSNPAQMAARSAAQLLLLKPYVWRILDVNVHGVANLDNVEGAFVAVANHSSHLDAALVFGAMPKKLSRYMATAAAGDHWFSKWYKAVVPALFFNAFPVERGKGHGKRGMAGSLLSDGVPLLIFAEGTRSRTGALGPLNPGAAALSISRGVPVIPIAIVGAYAAWPPYQKYPPTGRPPVHVVFGHPMSPVRGEIAHAFNERIRLKIIELYDTTARAYGMKTLAEYARTLAIEKSRGTSDAPEVSPDAPASAKDSDAPASPKDPDAPASPEADAPKKKRAKATKKPDDNADPASPTGP